MKRFLLISASVVAMTAAKPALADPITLAVAGASTAAAAVTAAASGTALTFFGLTGFGAIAAQFAVRAALGYAMNALTGKPGAETSRGYQGVNSLGTSLPHQVIYGETRVGGAVFYQALTSSGSGGNDRLHKMIAFAGHEIESYEKIYLNDEEVTLDAYGEVTDPAHYAGHVRIKQYLGTDDQAADDDAVSELSDWTINHRARGIAYLYVRFEDAAEFGTGAPVVTALIRGRKVEDTRGEVDDAETDTALSSFPSGEWAGTQDGGVGTKTGSVPTDEDDTDFNGTITGARFWVGVDHTPEIGALEPEADPDQTYEQGDTITNTDYDRTDDLFFAVDLTVPDTPTGVVAEIGAFVSGMYLGFTSGNLVFRAGDGGTGHPSDCAKVSIAASEFAGKTGTIYGQINPALDTVTLYFKDAASVTKWTDNPAMCLRDYLLADYGLENDAADVNDTLCRAAANKCDELVGSAKRYTCNGAFTLDAAPEDIIRNLLSSMGGIFWNYQGQWGMQAAQYVEPTLTLSEDDLRSELQIATRHSRRDNFNTIKGQFKGAETDYQPDDYPLVTSGLYLLEDDGVSAASDLPLLFSDTTVLAQRIARTALRRNRKQITVTGAFGLRALGLRIGDNVMLTVSHMGWLQKVFEVVDWRLGMKDGDIQVNMILREMSDEVFNGVSDTLNDESDNVLQDESGNSLEAIVA